MIIQLDGVQITNVPLRPSRSKKAPAVAAKVVGDNLLKPIRAVDQGPIPFTDVLAAVCRAPVVNGDRTQTSGGGAGANGRDRGTRTAHAIVYGCCGGDPRRYNFDDDFFDRSRKPHRKPGWRPRP